eukprot:gene39366-47919_t
MTSILAITLLALVCLCKISAFRYGVAGRGNKIARLAKKFDDADIVTVEVTKPLGLGLIENEENKKLGVCVDEIDKDGSLVKTGKVRKGMYLLTINEKDVRNEDFDTIIDMISGLPQSQPMKLSFIWPAKVYGGPAVVEVIKPDRTRVKINTLKGQNLRTVLLGSNIELYDNRAKFTNCAGGGTCGTCAVLIPDDEHWQKRAPFEAARLKKYSDKARLACNTVIEGDCTVTVQPPRILQ